MSNDQFDELLTELRDFRDEMRGLNLDLHQLRELLEEREEAYLPDEDFDLFLSDELGIDV